MVSFYFPLASEKGDKQSRINGSVENADITFVCEYCGQGFSSYNKRKSHLKEHKDKQVIVVMQYVSAFYTVQ